MNWPGKDQASRFLFNDYSSRRIMQCERCQEKGRWIEYDEKTSKTRIVHELCQECRFGWLKLMNLEFKLFGRKKDKMKAHENRRIKKYTQVHKDDEEDEEEDE